MIALYC